MRKRKLKDYLLYSIGEILLIVIGILLAVQVNNLNQKRIHSKNETQALKDLESEFQLNEKKISEKQKARTKIAPTLQKYIIEVSTGRADHSTFSEFHSNEFMHGMTNPSIGVIDALISSSEISLITNDSLKYLLTGWKNQLENLYENEQILWGSGLDFIGSYSSKIPDPRYEWADVNGKEVQSISNKILKSTPYRNKLVGFEGCNKIVIEECERVLDDVRKIRLLLRKEIESKG